VTLPGYAEVAARSNFSFLDGASHPEELVEQAAALGHAGFGLCDTNGLAGVVRAHGAAKAAGLAFAPGCRLRLEDGAEWLIWPADRAAYGRLTALLSAARMTAPKGECRLDFAGLCDAAEGQVMAAIPPVAPAALRRLAGLRLVLPPLIAVACPNILFPYARETVSDAVTRAGFSPIVLQPVNFEAMYMARTQEQSQPAVAETLQ
jgi:error-prone DNA polymerase